MSEGKHRARRKTTARRSTAFAVYSAGVLALTDPGPAAAGVVILGPDGRTVSQRAYYLGHAGHWEAEARALLAALRLCQSLGTEPVKLVVESRALADAIVSHLSSGPSNGVLDSALFNALDHVAVAAVPVVSPNRNPARAVALAPLVQWLPARTRRSQRLAVQAVRPGVYQVASESKPGQFYRVHLPSAAAVAAGESIRCECADFQYRGLPCKHLLLAAAASAGRERLFYPEAAGGAGIPAGPIEASASPEVLERGVGESS